MCFSTRVCLQRFVGRRPPAGFQVEEGVKKEQGDGKKNKNKNKEGAKGREARREAPPSGMCSGRNPDDPAGNGGDVCIVLPQQFSERPDGPGRDNLDPPCRRP